jgi:uncharacterized protein
LKTFKTGGVTLKVDYHHTFGLPRKMVWKYIKDEKVLGNAIPNCKTLVQSSNGVYLAQIDVQFGPIKDVFELEVRVEKEKAPSYFHLSLSGKGTLGEFSGTADAFLNDHQGSCKLQIIADVEVTGALAGAAQRVINGGANKGIEKFFLNLEIEMKRSLYISRKGRKA